MEVNIKYTNFGIAYAYGNTIELNRELLKYPELHKMVLEHEMEHIKKPSFMQTVIIELKDAFDFKKQKMLRQFPAKYKLQSSLPFWFDSSGFSYNLYLICLYSLLIITTITMFVIL